MRFLDALIPSRSQRMDPADGQYGAFQGSDPFGLGGMTGMGGSLTYTVNGASYTVPFATTDPGGKAESIANSFEGYVNGALAANSVIFSLTMARLRVFAQARFQFQNFNKGRPGDLFAKPSLSVLENPWPGGQTRDLLAVMLLHSDFGGNAYVALIDGQMVMMRPDWVDILLGDRKYVDSAGRSGTVGMEKLGYNFYQGGKSSGVKPMSFLADEVCHFSPIPDPLANYRGMSWLTPVVREVQADMAASGHKLKFWEQAATPNVAVSLAITDPEQFAGFVDKMDEQHKGWTNAYKTLYTGAGADVTVIGKDMQQMDFANVIGKGETRLAAAAGVPPSVAGLSEGLQGSSLNSGNFSAARRQFSDTTLSDLWANAAGSLEVIVPPPHGGARLWYDIRDIPFLREDIKDLAQIQYAKAQAMQELFVSGFEPDSIIAAIAADDLTLLKHGGGISIQVQTPSTNSKLLGSAVDELPEDMKVANPETPPALPPGTLPAALPPAL